jgi:nucleoside-diphosphate-sugar epimerase
MKALVTGSEGFVGSHVLEALKDWETLTLDRGDSFPTEPMDVVFSLAATGDPWEAVRDPVAAYVNDVGVIAQTLEYARETGAHVLHVSSSEAAGLRGPYAGAKRCQEIICETYRDVSVTVVVTQSLFGERQQPDKLVPTIIRRLLDGQPVRLQRGPRGWATRPFLHVRNLADALVHLAENPAGRRVHVGASELLSVQRVAHIVADELDIDCLIEAVPAGDRAGHEATVEPISCDIKGWEPTYDTITALKDVARWYALATADPTYPASSRQAA